MQPKNESNSSNLCSALNYSIPAFLFGAAVLMGNQSSNKAVDCRLIQTLSLCFLSLKDTYTTDTDSGHVCQAHTMAPTLLLCPGGWALQFYCTFEYDYIKFIWIETIWLCWHMCMCTLFACACMLITNTFTVCVPVSLQDYNYEDEIYEDPQPLNCSTTESIKGGHVTYSQVI